VTPIWLLAAVMKMKAFPSGSAVVVDKMKRRRLANAIRNFIWADSKNEAASTTILFLSNQLFEFFFGEGLNTQFLGFVEFGAGVLSNNYIIHFF
jgi:hypothetical protein